MMKDETANVAYFERSFMAFPSREKYSKKDCRWCGGSGKDRHKKGTPCRSCDGDGSVYVKRPVQRCATCKGSGNGQDAKDWTRQCKKCNGSGWASRFRTP